MNCSLLFRSCERFRFLDDIVLGDVIKGRFFDAMYFIRGLSGQLFQQGVVPAFQELTALSTQDVNAIYQISLQAFDSHCLFHQSEQDRQLGTQQSNPKAPPFVFHACQGLNVCAQQGHDGSGTMPGDGDCATAVPHTCGGTNDCQYQSGCGFSPYLPAYNQCKGQSEGHEQGGCQVPIAPDQVFARDMKTSVWDQARANLAKRDDVKTALKKHGKSELPPAPPTNERRKHVTPTKPKLNTHA